MYIYKKNILHILYLKAVFQVKNRIFNLKKITGNSCFKLTRQVFMMYIRNLDVLGKGFRLIQNFYWEQTTCMQIESEFNKYAKIESGCKCLLNLYEWSPNFFSALNFLMPRQISCDEKYI